MVGLTGNFGMGKSSVLETFGELGAFTVDADEIVHDLLEEPDVLKKLRPVLGDDVFAKDGTLDREKVSAKVFDNEDLRHAMEDVLHPLVFDRVEKMVKEADPKVAVVEATLIFERGHEGRFDRVVTVYTAPDIAIARLEEQGVPREDSAKRLMSQMPIEEKVERANYSIDNSGSPEETKAKTRIVYKVLVSEADEKG
jgi:dephospho-CoA kinase